MKAFRCTLAAGIVAGVMFAAVARAEEDSPSESARELMTGPARERMGWEAALDGAWLPERHSPDAAGDVGMSDGKVKIARTFRAGSDLSFTPELAYSILHISAPAGARLPEDLHTITAGLRTDLAVSPRTGLTFLIAPGLAGDFKAIGGDDLRVRVGATVRYTLSQKFTLLGGLVYQQGYKATRVLPVFGAVYRPTERWTINLAAPRPGVVYAVNRELRVSVGAEMAGGEYQLHEKSQGAEVIRYRDFRVAGGAEFAIVRGLKGEAAAGYAFSRRFSFYDVFDPTRRNVAVDSGPFLKAGLKMQW